MWIVGFALFTQINPYALTFRSRLEFWNEVCIVICIYHYFCFTDYVPNPETRYMIGTSLICVTLTCLALNAVLLVFFTLKNVKLSYLRLR